MKKLLMGATVALVGTTVAAHAVSVTLTDTLNETAQTLEYNFTGLAEMSDGDATLTLETVGTGIDGIDLGDGEGEYMDVLLDGFDLGRYECGVANDGGTTIPGSSGERNCQFSFDLTIVESDLVSIIADGMATLQLIMGPRVHYLIGNQNAGNEEIAATLAYTARVPVDDTPDVAPVPLPASVPLLLAGIGSLAVFRRRTRL